MNELKKRKMSKIDSVVNIFDCESYQLKRVYDKMIKIRLENEKNRLFHRHFNRNRRKK